MIKDSNNGANKVEARLWGQSKCEQATRQSSRPVKSNNDVAAQMSPRLLGGLGGAFPPLDPLLAGGADKRFPHV